MSTPRRRLGDRGESIAERFLAAQGYTLRQRNYHCRYGEVDLVCTDGPTLVFCEVKLRRSGAFGSPEEAVTTRKLSRVVLAAQTYLMENGCEDADWRLDVVAVELDQRGALARTSLYRGVSP